MAKKLTRFKVKKDTLITIRLSLKAQVTKISMAQVLLGYRSRNAMLLEAIDLGLDAICAKLGRQRIEGNMPLDLADLVNAYNCHRSAIPLTELTPNEVEALNDLYHSGEGDKVDVP